MNDCKKTLLCLENSVSVIRLDQPTLFDGKFEHWQDVLTAMILFSHFRAAGGKPCVITSRNNVNDFSYSRYHEVLKGLMNTMNIDYDIFEMYYDDSRNSINFFDYRTEQQYLVNMPPTTIDLSRIPVPDENITLSLIDGKNKQSLFVPVVLDQGRKTSSKRTKQVQSNKIGNYFNSEASSSNASMLLATNNQRLDKTVPTLPPITKNSLVKNVKKPVQLNGMKDYFPPI